MSSSLTYCMEAILFHKEKDVNIFQQETFHEFRKEATNQVGVHHSVYWQRHKEMMMGRRRNFPILLSLTIRTCYLELIITTKSHLIVKTSQLSLFVTSSIIMGLVSSSRGPWWDSTRPTHDSLLEYSVATSWKNWSTPQQRYYQCSVQLSGYSGYVCFCTTNWRWRGDWKANISWGNMQVFTTSHKSPSRYWTLKKRHWRNYRVPILTQHSWVYTKAP